MSIATTLLSGIVINQNATLSTTSSSAFSQTFSLPSDYQRGNYIPALTGFQVFANVTTPASAALTWTLDVQLSKPLAQSLPSATSTTNSGSPYSPPTAKAVAIAPPPSLWTTIASGTTTGTAQSGKTWFNVAFTNSLPVDSSWLGLSFRLNIQTVTGMTLGYSANGSLMYRILAATADHGTDFLGNVYRSALLESSASNIKAINTPNPNASWMSNPCPSRFGVEALYMDVRQNGQAVVIDRLTLDPVTPGVYFHVYYSNDATGPGTTVSQWENLLWTPVYKTFHLERMQTFALPEPIVAQYICIEFTNLQVRPYHPGNFQLPATYKKYPKWVWDHFIPLFTQVGIDKLSTSLDVVYDALDLAYTPHQGELVQTPDPPLLATPTPSTPQQKNQFIQPGEKVDSQSLQRISLNFTPFQSQPALMGDPASALAQYAASTAPQTYATEDVQRAVGNTNFVSNLQRDALLVEKGFPAMFFYLTSRHAFRLVQARFNHNIGYFAGLKQLMLHRDVYTAFADQPQYNETFGDGTNILINDWNTFAATPHP